MLKRVLLVDDADFMLDMLQMLLSGAGYVIAGVALSGMEALEFLRTSLEEGEAIVIVVVDFHMPKLDGVETIRRIKALLPKVKILLISANSTLPVALKAKEVGVDAFIVKPFESKTLLEAVRKLSQP
ncbi:MAG: response regulator [Fretibacterium sp.]|nr:response regulator [Fretibacterium sp.]